MPEFNGQFLDLAMIGAPVAVCTTDGNVVGLSEQAEAILRSVGVASTALPFALPRSLWQCLSGVERGEATKWSPDHDPTIYLGCSAYQLGDGHVMLLMREVSEKHVRLSRVLHRQRLESTGKLVAAIAHDLRAPLSSMVYNTELLAQERSSLGDADRREVVKDIHLACGRLKLTIDGLLDYARLGPQVEVDLALRETLQRVGSFVRPLMRDGNHLLEFEVAPDEAWVRGNPIVIEQVFVNLVVNATEAAGEAARVLIRTAPSHRADMLRVVVTDDGPGIPAPLRDRIFEPFFTTKSKGTGLGLTTSRQALRDLGGDLVLEPSTNGARMVVLLPRGCEKGAGGSL